MLFIDDNIVATQVLLECSKSYMQSGGLLKRFLYISTDEVYGDSTMSSSTESKTEDCKLQPTNPYAATKAAAEMLCSSYLHSYKLPIIISRSNNVYGSAQYREKLIPKFIELILNDKPCTIHGDGNYLRSFLYAFDVCTGLETMLLKGSVGHVYNIGSEDEFTVNDIADILIKHLKPNDNPSDWKVFVEDRAFNDTRYLISSDKLKLLGWKQSVSFDKGLQSTIDWYVKKQRLDSVHART
jgi:dTDP-glucose 4,6-dehydratase